MLYGSTESVSSTHTSPPIHLVDRSSFTRVLLPTDPVVSMVERLCFPSGELHLSELLSQVAEEPFVHGASFHLLHLLDEQ
jgi:hypothetical protein